MMNVTNGIYGSPYNEEELKVSKIIAVHQSTQIPHFSQQSKSLFLSRPFCSQGHDGNEGEFSGDLTLPS